MKKQIRPYFIILLVKVAVIESVFIGCGGGGSNSFDAVSSNTDENKTYTSPTTFSSARGTFYLSSAHSNFTALASEENTLKSNSSIPDFLASYSEFSNGTTSTIVKSI